MLNTKKHISASKNCFQRFLGQDIHVIQQKCWSSFEPYLIMAWQYPPMTFSGVMPTEPLNFAVSEKNIILHTVDYWLDDNDLLLPKSQRKPTAIQKLRDQVQNFPDKNFYILVCSPFLDQQNFFLDNPNVKIIYWADTYALSTGSYMRNTAPVPHKKFATDYHWIYLSLKPRICRLLAAVYLLGLDVKGTGLIYAPKSGLASHDSWQGVLDYLDYNQCDFLSDINHDHKVTLPDGFKHFKQGQHYIDNSDFLVPRKRLKHWTMEQPCSFANFRTFLQNFYLHTAVEIIGETVVISPGQITEKWCNSVYGFNFPIILGYHGSVQHLRNQGFDLFDDVIDHSYDTMPDPITRIFSAIDLNKSILENRELAISQWVACKDRFAANVEHMERLFATTEHIIHNNIEKFFLQNV